MLVLCLNIKTPIEFVDVSHIIPSHEWTYSEKNDFIVLFGQMEQRLSHVDRILTLLFRGIRFFCFRAWLTLAIGCRNRMYPSTGSSFDAKMINKE